jgi:hypothetical protein
MSLNDELLSDDPDSLAVEADDDDIQFTPEPDEDSGVVSIEPDIISIKRAERKRALRALPPEQK